MFPNHSSEIFFLTKKKSNDTVISNDNNINTIIIVLITSSSSSMNIFVNVQPLHYPATQFLFGSSQQKADTSLPISGTPCYLNYSFLPLTFLTSPTSCG